MVFDAQFERAMRRVWGSNPNTRFQLVDRNLYLIKCATKEDVKRIIDEGPWLYRNDMVVAVECPSEEDIKDSALKQGVVWVQYHHIPLESVNEEGVTILTKPIGLPLSDPVALTITVCVSSESKSSSLLTSH